MKFVLTADHPFYAGWLARHLGLPRDETAGSQYQTGYELANQTPDAMATSDGLRTRHEKFQEEVALGHLTVEVQA